MSAKGKTTEVCHWAQALLKGLDNGEENYKKAEANWLSTACLGYSIASLQKKAFRSPMYIRTGNSGVSRGERPVESRIRGNYLSPKT